MSVKMMRLCAGFSFVVELGAAVNLASAGGGGGGVATLSIGSGNGFSGSVSPSGTGAFSRTWVEPSCGGNCDAFESRMTLLTGGFTSGNTGVWEALGTARVWICVGGAAATATLEVRRASDGQIQDSVSVTMSGS